MKFDKDLPADLAGYLSEQGIAIFLFHGVIAKQTHQVRNYTGKHIEADLFEECMKALMKKGKPVSMDEVSKICESGENFPPNSFAITFDDGFENNISVAAPILEKLSIPSMIYVTTGFVEENSMSWIDRIEYVVETLPDQTISTSWHTDDFVLDSAESRINFLRAVRKYVKNTPTSDPNTFADEFCARFGKPGKLSTNDPLDLKMSWAQVKMAHEDSLLSIGGHSHTHGILSFLSPEELIFEIDTSLKLLSEKAGVPATHYCYPEGLAHCFSEEVINVLKSRGVKCCPTAINGTNTQHADPFHLRRIMINKE